MRITKSGLYYVIEFANTVRLSVHRLLLSIARQKAVGTLAHNTQGAVLLWAVKKIFNLADLLLNCTKTFTVAGEEVDVFTALNDIGGKSE